MPEWIFFGEGVAWLGGRASWWPSTSRRQHRAGLCWSRTQLAKGLMSSLKGGAWSGCAKDRCCTQLGLYLPDWKWTWMCEWQGYSAHTLAVGGDGNLRVGLSGRCCHPVLRVWALSCWCYCVLWDGELVACIESQYCLQGEEGGKEQLHLEGHQVTES